MVSCSYIEDHGDKVMKFWKSIINQEVVSFELEYTYNHKNDLIINILKGA